MVLVFQRRVRKVEVVEGWVPSDRRVVKLRLMITAAVDGSRCIKLLVDGCAGLIGEG
jgi:hypothetical protein